MQKPEKYSQSWSQIEQNYRKLNSLNLMDTMDLKGIAWVGNIYQKFEAMCLEVEETMVQETAKYVENQVQTMGASMKRFYSDVMQDFLPPSSIDPVKVAAADMLLNPYTDVGLYKKPKANIKEGTKKPVCIKGISEKDNSLTSEKSSLNNEVPKDQSLASSIGEINENDEAACDQMAMVSPQASVEAGGWGSWEEEVRICNSVLDASIASPGTGATELVESSVKKGKKVRYISSSKNLAAELTDTHGNSGLVFQIGSNTGTDTQYGQSVDREAFVSHSGTPGDCNLDMTEKTDTAELRMETDEQDSKSKFEETCILVDGDDVCPVAREERISRSYKKKIRSAFSLKMKSSRKQEYKQLAAQHGNVNSESGLKGVEDVMPTLKSNSNPKNLPSNDLLESEWELL